MKYIDNPIKGRIAVCVGTRPSFIKMSPIIKELDRRGKDYFIIHTGQHYSPELASIYDEQGVREPDYYVEYDPCKGDTHSGQLAQIMTGCEEAFRQYRPETVLVVGDANYSYASAMIARKLRLKLGHVEAGLRSGDWNTPEEHNRRMIDHVSDFLFCPTINNVLTLFSEHVPGIPMLTGNTICEHVYPTLSKEKKITITLHREENVDDKNKLLSILMEFNKLWDIFTDYEINFYAHPRTLKRMKEYNLDKLLLFKTSKAIPYKKFINEVASSSIVLTDSGGVQEESCIMGTPSIILRDKTERQETVEIGASMMYPSDGPLYDIISYMLDKEHEWKNPFSPLGINVSEYIIDYIEGLTR